MVPVCAPSSAASSTASTFTVCGVDQLVLSKLSGVARGVPPPEPTSS